MTPAPGSGPTKNPTGSEKGSSTDQLRTQMAATGGRNQRRITNLKSESLENQKGSTDEDVIILKSSIQAQVAMNNHLSWNDEKDRLKELLDLTKDDDEIDPVEKHAIRKNYLAFIRRPISDFINELAGPSKRPCQNSTPKDFVGTTPASAEVFQLCQSSPLTHGFSVEYDNDDVDVSTFDDLEYSVSI
jgi:hypothetical protein